MPAQVCESCLRAATGEEPFGVWSHLVSSWIKVFCTSLPFPISSLVLIVPTCANTPSTPMPSSSVNHSDPYFDNAPSEMLFKAAGQRRDFRIWNFPLIHIVQKNQYSASIEMPRDALTGRIQTVQLDNYHFFSRYAMHMRRYIMHKSILETERLYLAHQSSKPQEVSLKHKSKW